MFTTLWAQEKQLAHTQWGLGKQCTTFSSLKQTTKGNIKKPKEYMQLQNLSHRWTEICSHARVDILFQDKNSHSNPTVQEPVILQQLFISVAKSIPPQINEIPKQFHARLIIFHEISKWLSNQVCFVLFFVHNHSLYNITKLTVRLIKQGNREKLVLYSQPDSPFPQSKLVAQDLQAKSKMLNQANLLDVQKSTYSLRKV